MAMNWPVFEVRNIDYEVLRFLCMIFPSSLLNPLHSEIVVEL